MLSFSKQTYVVSSLVLLSAAILLFPLTSSAQGSVTPPGTEHYLVSSNPVLNPGSTLSRDIMRSVTKRSLGQSGGYGTDNLVAQKLSMPPLLGDQSFIDSGGETEDYAVGQIKNFIPDFGNNRRGNVAITLPAMKGLRHVLDSEVTKQLLVDLTSSQAAVLMQTYMMVENGAATGFMGGMNIGSNLLSNNLQTQDYQLKLMDITDNSGKLKEAYVRTVAEKMREPEFVDNWPAALYMASGEDGQKLTTTTARLLDMRDGGQRPFDFHNIVVSDSPGVTIRRFTDLNFIADPALFGDPSLVGSPPLANASTTMSTIAVNYEMNTDRVKYLKNDFKRLFGDIEMEVREVGSSKSARNISYRYIPPAPDTESSRLRGIAAVNWEEVQVVWENINSLLYDVCVWKRSKTNRDKKIFEKETLATTSEIGKVRGNTDNNPWELASAPDIPMTINVLELLYSKVDNLDPQQANSCDALRLTRDDIPEQYKNADSSQFANCGPQGGCLKNRIVLKLSYLIARSRTLSQYRMLYSISKRFATDPFLAELLDEIVARSLSGMNLDEELINNRAQYDDFVQYVARDAQGYSGGGTSLMPSTSGAISPGDGTLGGNS